MTVKELIEALKQFHPHMEVIIEVDDGQTGVNCVYEEQWRDWFFKQHTEVIIKGN